jgi:hypothetical protein
VDALPRHSWAELLDGALTTMTPAVLAWLDSLLPSFDCLAGRTATSMWLRLIAFSAAA